MARHRVMDVRAVMRSKIVPNEHPMEIGAGDIVRPQKSRKILVVVPRALKHLIQRRGRSTLL